MNMMKKLLAIVMTMGCWISYAQTDCTVYCDTLFMLTVVESETVKEPRAVIMEPNMGSFWVKDVRGLVLDTSSYIALFNSLIPNTIIAKDILHDYERSWSSTCTSSFKNYRSMFKDFLKITSKLEKPQYMTKLRCSISNDRFYSYEFKDTILADVSISVYVQKMVVEYYRVPYKHDESTVDFQYDYGQYPIKYRYQVKQIKNVLRPKEYEVPVLLDAQMEYTTGVAKDTVWERLELYYDDFDEDGVCDLMPHIFDQKDKSEFNFIEETDPATIKRVFYRMTADSLDECKKCKKNNGIDTRGKLVINFYTSDVRKCAVFYLNRNYFYYPARRKICFLPDDIYRWLKDRGVIGDR